MSTKLKFKAVGTVHTGRYPKGYWTKVLGGYIPTDLGVASLDRQRRGYQDQRVEQPPRQNGS